MWAAAHQYARAAGDAAGLHIAGGDRAALTTRRGSAHVRVEISQMMSAGHVSIDGSGP